MLSRISLRHSIPLLLGLFALIALLLLLGLHLPRHERDAEQALKEQSRQLLTLLQSSLNDHLRLNRGEELESELADLGSLGGVRWAAVVDRQLQPQASTRQDLALSGYPGLRELFHSARPQWQAQGEHRYLSFHPLSSGRDLAASRQYALVVQWDFAPLLARQLRNTWLQLAEIPVLLLILGALLNHLYNRLVTRRLEALGAVADAFAAGTSQARAEIAGNDEISRLAERFNHMIEQLESDRRALHDSEQLLRRLIEAAPVGMLVLGADGRVESANPAATQIFDCRPAQLVGRSAEQLLMGQAVRARLLAQPNQSLEFAGRRHNGSFPLEASCTPFLRDGQALQLLLVRDISDRKEAENRLHYLAHYDPLTGVANRTHLLARLELGLQCREAQALLFIDLDHFKRINDTLGHEIGDQLLCAVAERLRKCAPPGAMLARLGGDEFILLLSAELASQADGIAEQLLEAFRAPFQISQYELFTSPSIGISHQQDGRTSASQLLKEADLALYQAKGRGRNRLAHFDSSLADDAQQRHQLEAELRSALARGEFELHYQPQLDREGRQHTFEALLRWHSPRRGLVSSAQFMAVLEETGLIIDATRWIFRQACRQLRQWQDEGRDWGIAVNLSPLDFRQGDLAGALLAILAEERPPVQRLELEITETTLLDADQQVRDTLHALKQAGLSLFLDDFGTGYASLAYLQFFPFDGVKIDRQFVSGLPDCRQSVALVRGILVIAEQLGMQVVAEGVENQRQADFLRRNGCHRLQGYLFGRPQSAAACAGHDTPEPLASV